MTNEEILDILFRTGAIDAADETFKAINIERLIEDPIVTNRIAVEVLQRLPHGSKVDAIVCTPESGTLFAYSTATAAWAKFIVADTSSELAELLNGATFKKNDKILVIDDVISDSKAVRAVMAAAKDCEASVIGLGGIFASQAVVEEMKAEKVPVYALIECSIEEEAK